jgi:hypothetical protein
VKEVAVARRRRTAAAFLTSNQLPVMRIFLDKPAGLLYSVTLSPYEPARGRVDSTTLAVVFEQLQYRYILSAPIPEWKALDSIDDAELEDLFEEAIT